MYAKSTKNEPVETEEGYMDEKLSKFDLVLGVIMRLASRFTKQECEIMENITNVPVLMGDSEGFEGKYRSISQVQSILKSWRKNKVEGITSDEIDKLCHISQAIKQDKTEGFEKLGFEKISVNLSEDRMYALPVISGCIMKKDHTFLGVACTIDSGATSSASGEGLLRDLGLTVKDITPCPHIQVNTANSPCQPLGILSTRIYLKWKENKFFYIQCEILILSSPLSKLLIGIKDLYKANFILNKDQITLDCYSTKNSPKRRIFKTYSTLNSFSPIPLNPISTDGSVLCFESAHHIELLEGQWKIKEKSEEESKSENSFQVTKDMLICQSGKVNSEGEDVKKLWFEGKLNIGNQMKIKKENIYTLEKVEGEGIKEESEEEVIQEISQAVNDFHCLMSEEDRNKYKPFGQAQSELESVKNVEEELLDKMSLFPESGPEEGDKEYYLPDLSSLKEEWKGRFTELFEKYKTCFSKDKWDIGISNLPEITLHTKPGEVASDTCRRYTEEELQIVDNYLEGLERKGLIRKLQPDEVSAWNHNIHLVVRQAGGARKFCNSLADKGSLEERLKLLRESSRAVADTVKLNKLLLPVGQIYLPLVSEILPYLGGKICSLTDLRSGYSVIRMDYESCLKTAFTHRNIRYMNLVMVQGISSSPLLFSLRLELVFNEASFKEFLKKYAPNSKLIYQRAIIRYLDDLLLICDTMEEMYLLWHYLMIQLDKHKIKITKSKTKIAHESFTFLGWDFIPSKHLYSMESQRRSSLAKWEFKANKSYLISRLCTLNWNSNLIFGFKYLSQLLALLVQTKPMQVKKAHFREWQLMLFSASLTLHLYIPDLSRNIYLSSDSSYSCCGAFAFQYFPEKICSTPEGIKWDKADDGTLPLKNKAGEDCVLSRIECIGMFSKRWGKSEIAKSIVYKESIALMATLREYDMIIRSCTGKVLLFTDASCLSFIHRLKSVNSKIYTIALIVGSYSNVSVHFSRGAFLNFVSDIMSRTLENNHIQWEGAIDSKVLEQIPQQFISGVTISPELLHKICLSPLNPTFSALAVRRVQPFERILSESKMNDLFETGRLPEEDILNGVCFGRDYIKKDSVIFQNKTNKNMMSQSDFQKLSQKMNFDKIRSQILFLSAHSHHSEPEGEMEELCREFLNNLKSFMEENEELKKIDLLTDLNGLLRLPTISWGEFYDFMKAFQKSAAYNTEYNYDDLQPCLFIPTYIEERSEIYLEFNEGQLYLRAKCEKLIKSGDPVTFAIHLEFLTKYFFSLIQEMPGLFYAMISEDSLSKKINYIILGCNQDGEFKVEKNQIIGKVLFHFSQNETCNCVSPLQFHFIVEKQCQISGQRDVQLLLCELLYRDACDLINCVYCGEELCVCWPLEVMVAENNQETADNDPELESSSLSCHLHQHRKNHGDSLQTAEPEGKISYLNQLISLSLSYQRKNIFAPKYVQQLQCSSEYLLKMRELVKLRKTNKYFLFKGCLFYKAKGRDLLCLDNSTTALLFQDLHQRGFHSSKESLLEHYSKFFKCKDEKILAEASIKNCSICTFCFDNRMQTYVKNYRDEILLKPFESLHVDLCENVYLSENNYHSFVIAVCRSTNKVFGRPLKSKTAEEIVAFFEDLISFLGLFKNLYSDFASCFRSTEFLNFIGKYKINHIQSCPSRSEENGTCEERVKQVRNKLKYLICQDSLHRKQRWEQFFNQALLLVNSSAPYRKINNFSRDKLFFGPNRYIKSLSFNEEFDLPLNDETHQQILQKLHIFKLNCRKNYKDIDNPFNLGQIVTMKVSKEDLPHDGRGRHLQPNNPDLFKVIGLNRTSCRLLDLLTSDRRTVDFGKLRGLTVGEIKNVFENINFNKDSSFDKNIFRRGNGRSCLELVNDLNNRLFASESEKFLWGEGHETNKSPRDGDSDTQSTNQSPESEETGEQGVVEQLASDGDEVAASRGYPDVWRDSDTREGEFDRQDTIRAIANHPDPSQIIQQWDRENDFILRNSERNNRYPLRDRRPSRKIREMTMLTEPNDNCQAPVQIQNPKDLENPQDEPQNPNRNSPNWDSCQPQVPSPNQNPLKLRTPNPKVRFNSYVLKRTTLFDDNNEPIFDRKTKKFESEDNLEFDRQPRQKYFEARRGIKLDEDVSQREFHLLN